ncbi:16S rRNA (cytidine(1402)-2'-O)-methyltransferase [Gulosibacter sp. ACHW.36C]|uniref:Ribosomal RNA small subunit methyltransferase I n=1 Tax=Gulosibacter sediminis TaxID=1729695 RepID=A0ABY4MZ07_9MICO|nr:16S rRNA (cytidine(1402)-2'-O)-methyltransferase [Gulosibacter sediminis]UQN15680.1 16S rRNA (cytidine(1402)-2'-O)-methyltransferase [Gulosibacter sediminis]
MLILAGTPIGNLGDASSRLADTLRAADLIACEDTRTTAKLLGLLEVTERPKLIALHEHNEHEAADEVARLAAAQTVVLVSDAGMPAISDPGFRVVRACAEAGVTVTSVPGPSAVITALAVAGLPTDRFCFEGFVPRKQSDRAKLVEQLADEPRTTVLYESPHRLATTLDDFAAAWPARQVVVCRELTKLHEEVRRGTCAELAQWASEGVRGEIVLVLAGAEAREVQLDDAVAEVLRLAAGGLRLKDAAAEVEARTGLRKRALYDAALAARGVNGAV